MVGKIKITYKATVFLVLIIFSNNLYPGNEYFPGGIIYLPLSQNESNDNFYYKNHLITKIDKDNKLYLLFGIPYYSKEGFNEYLFKSKTREKKVTINIIKKNYSSQNINIKKYKTKSKEELTRIIFEKNELIEAKKRHYNEYPDTSFIMPAYGVTTGTYGTKRYYNGKKGKFHNGHDIAAETGTYIFAPSAGKVMLTGDYYYNGKFVMLNHGNNLISMFLHMNEISVSNNQIIRKGQKIGTIGNTGLSTGPHLHWSVLANNEYIDPLVLIDNTTP